MSSKTKKITQSQLKKGLPEIKPGDTVRIHQKIKDQEKERTQMFEGLVLTKKHGKGISATITVRSKISGIGVEKVFPLHSPTIEKIEIIKRTKPRRKKLYYLRDASGKRAKLKRKELKKPLVWKKPEEKKEKSKEEKTEKKKAKESSTSTNKKGKVEENKKK